jgi:hypothetical protein
MSEQHPRSMQPKEDEQFLLDYDDGANGKTLRIDIQTMQVLKR